MVRVGKAATSATANRPDQQKKKKGCTRRDIVLGFWIGLAGAAIYVNVKRKPVIKAPEEQTDLSVSGSVSGTARVRIEKTAIDAVQSGLSTTDTVQSGLSTTDTSQSGLSTTDTSQSGLSTTDTAQSSLSTTETAQSSLSTSGTGKQRDFREIARRTGTDKVYGADKLAGCLADNASCGMPTEVQPRCRVLQGHFYHTLYQKWLGPYSTDDTEPFQFLEVGHYTGKGFEAYKEFMPKAETHSIEIACLPEGPREEGKWPWGNFPKQNPRYQEFLDTNQLHCGDGSNYDFLYETWTTKMKRPDAPPLKVVVDDASHLSDHMAKSLFFWFPKIEPGGIMVIEDIQPIQEAHLFREHVVPQLLKDLHYCGDPKWRDSPCFPTIWPLLHSVHCELHICVLERNEMPSVEITREQATPPPNTLNGAECLLRSTDV